MNKTLVPLAALFFTTSTYAHDTLSTHSHSGEGIAAILMLISLFALYSRLKEK